MVASLIARVFASRLAWVSATPLGSPVLPDVYWMKANSGGVSTQNNPVVPSLREATVTDCRREGVTVHSRSAAALNSGSAMTNAAPALRRIRPWRST